MKDILSAILEDSLDEMDNCDTIQEAAESVSYSPLDVLMETPGSSEIMDELFPSALHREYSKLL